MPCELKPVVSGDGEGMLPVGQQQVRVGLGHLPGVLAVRQELDEDEVGAAFGEQQDGPVPVLARDDVHLLVAEALAISFCRTVVYAHAVGDAPNGSHGSFPVLKPMAANLVEVIPPSDLSLQMALYIVSCDMRTLWSAIQPDICSGNHCSSRSSLSASSVTRLRIFLFSSRRSFRVSTRTSSTRATLTPTKRLGREGKRPLWPLHQELREVHDE